MATENKFDKLRSMVHQGVPLEKTMENTTPEEAVRQRGFGSYRTSIQSS